MQSTESCHQPKAGLLTAIWDRHLLVAFRGSLGRRYTSASAAACLEATIGQGALRVPADALAGQRAGLLRLGLQHVCRHQDAACAARLAAFRHAHQAQDTPSQAGHDHAAAKDQQGASPPGGA